MIYRWYACDSDCSEGYLCSKPLGHKGLCAAEFTQGPVFKFTYQKPKYECKIPITITEKDIIENNLDKDYVVKNQWSADDYFEHSSYPQIEIIQN